MQEGDFFGAVTTCLFTRLDFSSMVNKQVGAIMTIFTIVSVHPDKIGKTYKMTEGKYDMAFKASVCFVLFCFYCQ